MQAEGLTNQNNKSIENEILGRQETTTTVEISIWSYSDVVDITRSCYVLYQYEPPNSSREQRDQSSITLTYSNLLKWAMNMRLTYMELT